MTDRRARRWFQLSLKSLFLLTLLVTTFFAGYSLATKRDEEAIRAERESRRLTDERMSQVELEIQRLHSLFHRDHDLRVWQSVLTAPPVSGGR